MSYLIHIHRVLRTPAHSKGDLHPLLHPKRVIKLSIFLQIISLQMYLGIAYLRNERVVGKLIRQVRCDSDSPSI